ncbi:hypothetical protein RND71_014406 [Anisodus tanguticus]|uniref:PNPLA domain-containing protein n=1 Tax=Anisodus tanguticus TaxID=243964 RepID=A0AAE1SB76_9SOLA|nr:hypothetical protein RND71_014406 [Anisodus tanguticus]
MRSILSGKALASLEQALKVKSGNPDARIADYFDVAAGSGVGGIFITMLFSTNDQNCRLFHADDTWKLLADQGKKFYPTRGPNYGGFLRRIFRSTGSATAGLEKSMKEAFVDKTGRSLTLKDTLKPVLIPCYDLCSTAPFCSPERMLWRPTTLTSGYGRSAERRTGQLLEGSFKYEQVKNWKAKDWARPMARISGDGSADMVDQSVAMAFGQYRSTNYVRVQVLAWIIDSVVVLYATRETVQS